MLDLTSMTLRTMTFLPLFARTPVGLQSLFDSCLLSPLVKRPHPLKGDSASSAMPATISPLAPQSPGDESVDVGSASASSTLPSYTMSPPAPRYERAGISHPAPSADSTDGGERESCGSPLDRYSCVGNQPFQEDPTPLRAAQGPPGQYTMPFLRFEHGRCWPITVCALPCVTWSDRLTCFPKWL